MTHEFIKMIEAYGRAKAKGLSCVMATVVALEGSSYRRPGVAMLIREDGKMVGAVSGGCVEKEVYRQSKTVFQDKIPKMMVYDGRYRLGCEGVLYILIEPFAPGPECLESFETTRKERKSFELISVYSKEISANKALGTYFKAFAGGEWPLSGNPLSKNFGNGAVFSRSLPPCFKLMIIGAEHDAVQLCTYASLTGWDVTVVAPPMEEKQLKDFPGARELWNTEPENLSTGQIDGETAVLVMTHSYVRDLKYLLALQQTKPAYLGLLGPLKRREKLLGEMMEHHWEVSPDFLEKIHGPTGLDIGSETPQEIAVAVIAEILSVIRKRRPIHLKNKEGAIHS